VYIIGGLVDRSHQKGRSKQAAIDMGVESVRIPVKEYFARTFPLECGTGGHKCDSKSDVVLNVNTVLDILAEFETCGDIDVAMQNAIPRRLNIRVQSKSTKELSSVTRNQFLQVHRDVSVASKLTEPTTEVSQIVLSSSSSNSVLDKI
jgi:hypothetical protein